MQLEGKVALLTGAVRRNGRAMARALAGEGANIVINTRASAEEAEATITEIKTLGVDAMAHLADVADERAVADMIEAVAGCRLQRIPARGWKLRLVGRHPNSRG